MNIICIGQTVVDQISIVNSLPFPDGKVSPLSSKIDLGGTACAVAVFLRRMGLKPTLITAIGQDSMGQFVKRRLKKIGLRLIIQPADQTLINQVIVEKKSGQRSIIKGLVKTSIIKHLPTDLIKKADLIFADRHQPLAFKKLAKTRNPSTQLVVDPSTVVSNHTLSMVKQAHYPIVPIEFVKKLKNQSSNLQEKLKLLLKLTQKPTTVTRGKLGCLHVSSTQTIISPPLKVNSKDNLGAGDIFRGAFIFGLIKNWPIHKTLTFANAAGALQTTKIGNISAIPSKRTILKLIKSTGGL